MLKSLWRHSTILLIILSITITSCRQLIGSSSAQGNNQLVSAILSDPKTFNPALSSESPNIFGYVGEGLITENGKGEIEPALAESWQISADSKSIIFKLRQNLKWSDGAPLTIDDVSFTFNEVYFNEEIRSEERRVGKEC